MLTAPSKMIPIFNFGFTISILLCAAPDRSSEAAYMRKEFRKRLVLCQLLQVIIFSY